MKRRNSLAVYGGGNELQDEPDKPTGLENGNIRLLQEIVEQLDGTRFFYPASASGSREFVTRDRGVSHDVHGNWKYLGDPAHYELYGESDNLFHSEFGTCPCEIPEKNPASGGAASYAHERKSGLAAPRGVVGNL